MERKLAGMPASPRKRVDPSGLWIETTAFRQMTISKFLKGLEERFGPFETVKPKMLHTKAINRFIEKVEAAHRITAKSKQVFKMAVS